MSDQPNTIVTIQEQLEAIAQNVVNLDEYGERLEVLAQKYEGNKEVQVILRDNWALANQANEASAVAAALAATAQQFAQQRDLVIGERDQVIEQMADLELQAEAREEQAFQDGIEVGEEGSYEYYQESAWDDMSYNMKRYLECSDDGIELFFQVARDGYVGGLSQDALLAVGAAIDALLEGKRAHQAGD